jgi:4-hydroxy-3-methylbut-2-enyl diphosphate reductase
VHKQVANKMVDQFKSTLVEQMKGSTFETVQGEGDSQVTFLLAKEYGFCWGVERSIELAWAAREAFPDKRMHLTNELIHNPQVNKLLADMDVSFIEKTETGKRFEDVQDGDVVILPAFGASLDEMQLLDAKVRERARKCRWLCTTCLCSDFRPARVACSGHGRMRHGRLTPARAWRRFAPRRLARAPLARDRASRSSTRPARG